MKRKEKMKMRYKLTLLKDLPKYPAGTVFKYYKQKEMTLGSWTEWEFLGVAGSGELPGCLAGYDDLLIPREIIDNPDWIKKEPDLDSLYDLKCPICGETCGQMTVKAFRKESRDGGYFNSAEVYFEYVCGHPSRRFY